MLTIKELCEKYKLSQTALSKRFGVPLRTVQDWYSERRTPPVYMVGMMEELLSRDAQEQQPSYTLTLTPAEAEKLTKFIEEYVEQHKK